MVGTVAPSTGWDGVEILFFQWVPSSSSGSSNPKNCMCLSTCGIGLLKNLGIRWNSKCYQESLTRSQCVYFHNKTSHVKRKAEDGLSCALHNRWLASIDQFYLSATCHTLICWYVAKLERVGLRLYYRYITRYFTNSLVSEVYLLIFKLFRLFLFRVMDINFIVMTHKIYWEEKKFVYIKILIRELIRISTNLKQFD